jgi:RimJ/RimL family protein N-acetyltransferase
MENISVVNKLHPNSTISELKVSNESNTYSLAPEYISTDSLELVPIFEANFNDIRELYRYTDDEVFLNYGSNRHMLPSETRDYVISKREMWNSADWFEYVIVFEDNLIGKTYLNPHSRLDEFESGIWLQKEYWGREFSQEIADAFMYICFELLDASFIAVGCVIQNVKSRKAIEKYIDRYNGSFYGCIPKSDAVYQFTCKRPYGCCKSS